jgi:hypothetical protein
MSSAAESPGLMGFDIARLTSLAVSTPSVAFEGNWATVELQPDAFVPQRFTVGVVVQSENDRLHFKLLDDFKKFDCVYRDHFPGKSAAELVAFAESVLRQAVREKRGMRDLAFGTNCLMLATPAFTSGDDRESTVERLFKDLVVMAPSPKKKGNDFPTIDTPHARSLVNEQLKRIAHGDFDRIVVPEHEPVVLDVDGVRSQFDLNLLTGRFCGSVTSAVFKTPQSVEINLLKSSRDLTTYSRMKKVDSIGLFLLLPEAARMEGKEFKRIEEVIADYEWQLSKDGFRVVSLPSAEQLAREVYDWALPSFA